MQCSSAQKLQKEANFKTDQAYYQSWVAGIKGGGSGINVFIPVTSKLKDLKLDSLYFKGHKVALVTKPQNPNLFIGRILAEANQKDDFLSESKQAIPFDLKENEAVISYTENGTTNYIKIENIVEKQAEQYPSAPPKN
ncbi:MAG: hypothetical protein WBF67_12255 [Olleya sp.]